MMHDATKTLSLSVVMIAHNEAHRIRRSLDSVKELASTRLMLYEICKAHDAKQDVKILHGKCSMIKLLASEMANRIADRAVQIFGGRGYMRENVAERYYRELRVDRIWEGTSEIQRLIIARSMQKRGLDGM